MTTTMTYVERNAHTLARLDELVIGHDNAKKVLINLVNRSKLRYYQRHGLGHKLEDLVKITNCLLIGDSGTGKTHLVNSLSSIMEFPLLHIDATELNPTGASGGIKKADLIDKVVETVKEAMARDPKTYWSYEGTLDQVVVFIDEVDKLGQRVSSDWNQHVQANFLKLIEGDDSGVSYIFAGAFTGLDKTGKATSTGIGFSRPEATAPKAGDLAASIVKFGLIPEFVGRLHNIVTLDVLKHEHYSHILNTIVIPKSTKSLELYGIYDYQFNTETLDKLIEDAIASGLGVRALETGVNKLLVEIEFNPFAYGAKGLTLEKTL